MIKKNGRFNLERFGWVCLYIGIFTIPFAPPVSLGLLVFGGLVATIYHSRSG